MRKTALRLVFSIAVVTLLVLYFVDARELARILQSFDPRYLLLALAVITLDRILMTYKWLLLLRAQGHRLGLWRGVTIYCSSMVWGFALPTTLGADAIRAIMASKRGINGTDIVTSILIERVVGFIIALALGIVCLAILRLVGVFHPQFDSILYLAMATLAGSIVVLIATLDKRAARFLLDRMPGALRQTKVAQVLTRFAEAYQALGRSRSTMRRFAALTALEQLLSVALPWATARGLGVEVDLLVLLGALPISVLISRLPISFDGLGVFEAVFMALLALAGVPAESALAMAISGRILQLVAFLPWWFAQVVQAGEVRPPQRAALRTPATPIAPRNP